MYRLVQVHSDTYEGWDVETALVSQLLGSDSRCLLFAAVLDPEVMGFNIPTAVRFALVSCVSSLTAYILFENFLEASI